MRKTTLTKCILCVSEAFPFYINEREGGEYFHCPNCDLRFKNPKYNLSPENEKERYLKHQNSVNDLGYQNYIRPLFDLVCIKVPNSSKGLDFGCGFAPALSHMLQQKSYEMKLFDPFFHVEQSVLTQKYDFIVSVEVVEHFYEPGKEFSLLRELLKKNGKIIIMTRLFEDSIDFDKWFYRRDPTHVSFYSRNTFKWIQKKFKFSILEFHQDRVVFLEL